MCMLMDLATHSIGTVVQPGTVLLTLVPEHETLRAEVWLSNEDIGFVKKGQKARSCWEPAPCSSTCCRRSRRAGTSPAGNVNLNTGS